MHYLSEIADFSRMVTIPETSEDVRKKAKLLILDSLTAITIGNQDSKVCSFAKSATSSQTNDNNDRELILGTSLLTDHRTAALINGVGIVSDELDEGNAIAKGHPACHFFPALLSLSLQHNKSGKDLLAAFIVNYEISARMGASVQLKESVHPHGNWGVFGNGFGVGKLLGWTSENDYIQAAMLSTSFSMPTLWQSVLEGHQVRNITIGLNNFHTTLLPDLIKAQFSASLSTPEQIFNGILAERFESAYMRKDLGAKFLLLDSYFKFYPYCRFCHSSIDAVLSLIDGLEIETIKEIRVHTYSLAAKLKERQVNNEFAGKFSIPYAVSNEVCLEKYPLLVGKEKEEVIQNLMDKVIVTEEKSYTDLLPDKRGTNVEIEWWSGEIKKATTYRAKGDPDEDKLNEKVIQKCQAYLSPLLGEEKVEKIIKNILNLEQVQDLSIITKLFAK